MYLQIKLKLRLGLGLRVPANSPSLAQLAASHIVCSALGMGCSSSLSLVAAHSEASLCVKQNITGIRKLGFVNTRSAMYSQAKLVKGVGNIA